MTGGTKLRVVVVDDSAAGRAAIAEVLENAPNIEVVGRAMDGVQALRLVHDLSPDAITLDLEMPGMDGFTFLRLLRAQKPTPVVVVSTDSRPEASLTALELGALDFVVKPGRLGGASLIQMGLELIAKLGMVVGCEASDYQRRVHEFSAKEKTLTSLRVLPEKVDLVAIGASTGGPMAIQTVLQDLGEPLACPIIVAQHMPSPFTNAYAARLNSMLQHYVTEARDGDVLKAGRVLIAPGGRQTWVERDVHNHLVARVAPGAKQSTFAPSIDQLFHSVAETVAEAAVAVVLTGMGADGALGAQAIEARGGYVVTESEATALINGMPQSAREKCVAAQSLRLGQMARLLRRLAGGGLRPS